MPKMQRSNEGTALVQDHITCTERRNQPRLHHAICESTCKYREDCIGYRTWYKNAHGVDLETKSKKIKKVRRTRRKRKIK